MLWVVVVPISLLILALSYLAFTFSNVLSKADKVTYDSPIGRIVSEAKEQNSNALKYNAQSTKMIGDLNQSLQKQIANITSSSNLVDSKSNFVDKLTPISENLNKQLKILAEQKSELEKTSEDISKIERKLKSDSSAR